MTHKLFTLSLAVLASISFANAEIYDGTCGDSLTWSLNTEDSTLTIVGSGEMTSAPWLEYAESIKIVNLSDSLTNIITDAFRWCNHMTFIKIPNSVTSIGDAAFWGCTGLVSVTLSNSLTLISHSLFAHCDRLRSIEIPNSVESIVDAAFYDCIMLTSAIIGNSVTSIGENVFERCQSLQSVIIGKSVTSIGQTAFLGCTGLTEVTCEAVTPPTLGLGAFYQVNQSDCALYVPSASIDLYKAADQWKDFYNILALEEANEIVSDTKPSSKILHNGHIIIRSDKTFTVTGQQVKLYDY